MSKYRNNKTEVDGMVFDSRKEAYYYKKLKLMLLAGEISNLRTQVTYELVPAIWRDEVKHLKTKDKIVKKLVQRAINYIADFVYTSTATGEECVIDCKGFRTKEYLIKKKMMLALKGISIIEV